MEAIKLLELAVGLTVGLLLVLMIVGAYRVLREPPKKEKLTGDLRRILTVEGLSTLTPEDLNQLQEGIMLGTVRYHSALHAFVEEATPEAEQRARTPTLYGYKFPVEPYSNLSHRSPGEWSQPVCIRANPATMEWEIQHWAVRWPLYARLQASGAVEPLATVDKPHTMSGAQPSAIAMGLTAPTTNKPGNPATNPYR